MSHNATLPGKRMRPQGNWGSSGPFEEFHKEDMMYLWTIVINFSILLAMYKYRRYTMLLHFLFTLAIATVTIVYSFPLLLSKAIPANTSPLKAHMIVGIAILSLICLEVVLGCFCKALNLFKVPSVLLHYINKAHAVIGYSLAILCKFQYYYIVKKKNYVYWILLTQDILFAFLIVARKIYFPTLQKKIEPNYANTEDIPSITSFADLYEKQSNDSQNKVPIADKDYCSFGNYVYDLTPLKLVHPAGYQILQIVRSREIDRFIYGMFRAELLPRLPTHSHSSKSFELLGKPTAKIEIAVPYKNMPATPFPVSVERIQSISIKCQIYQIQLKSDIPFEYEGYSDVRQLGRFYSLTINKKVTRLYTAVNFLHPSNIDLLRSLSFMETIQTQIIAPSTEIELQTQRYCRFESRLDGCVPLLVKVYEQGTLPNLIISNEVHNMTLSSPKGFGLKLSEAKEGTILMIAGGTGLYPFSDLIDLLFKDYLLSLTHPLREAILKRNPILAKQPFARHHFKLLLACQSLLDIHPITFQQLKMLANSPTFQLKLKLRQKADASKLEGITLTSSSFETVLAEELKLMKDLSKVWLCGPPKMCESISQFFSKNYKDQDLIHLI